MIQAMRVWCSTAKAASLRMARRGKSGKQVADYRHEDAKRLNNPPAGLAWQDTEKPVKRRFG